MDILADIKATTSKLELTHPGTGDAVGLTLDIRPFHDKRCKAVQDAITNRRQKLAARGKNFTASEIEENKIEVLASAIDGWEWTKDASGRPGSFSGEQIKFNIANARKLVAIEWIATQVTERLDDETRFFLN